MRRSRKSGGAAWTASRRKSPRCRGERVVYRAGGCEPCAAPGDSLGSAAHIADSRGCGEAVAQRQAVDCGGEYRDRADPEFVHAAAGRRKDHGREPGEVLPPEEWQGVIGDW